MAFYEEKQLRAFKCAELIFSRNRKDLKFVSKFVPNQWTDKDTSTKISTTHTHAIVAILECTHQWIVGVLCWAMFKVQWIWCERANKEKKQHHSLTHSMEFTSKTLNQDWKWHKYTHERILTRAYASGHIRPFLFTFRISLLLWVCTFFLQQKKEQRHATFSLWYVWFSLSQCNLLCVARAGLFACGAAHSRTKKR